MSKEELLKQQAGVIIVNVLSPLGAPAQEGAAQVPARRRVLAGVSTIPAPSTNAQWEYIGEAVAKELDFSRMWLRLNDADGGDKDGIVAEWKGETKALLERALDGPTELALADPVHEDKKSTVNLEAHENANNQGLLRVDLLDGHSIHAADRGGKSDPFVVFTLNSQRNFVVQVPSRAGADFQLEGFDWKLIEQAKSLGSAKHGDNGKIRVRLLFAPEIIVKTRKNRSAFTTAGRAMAQLGHLPSGAGKGVFHGATGVFKKHGSNSIPDSEEERSPELPAGVVAKQVDYAAEGMTPAAFLSVNEGGAHSRNPGALRVVVKDTKDLSTADLKPYVVVRVGNKEHKAKHAHNTATPVNGYFVFAAAPVTQPKRFVWIYDHRTLGKDKMLGPADIDLQPGEAVPPKDLTVELREGQGLLHLRLEYDPDTPLSTKGSRTSLHFISGNGPPISHPSRSSLSRQRGGNCAD
ncbi:hypothetical protein OH77DRAFT_1524327 [Trametes cingulata]|nr:hypothetical protein OH77DRAFT_1524327 [Trametes cingulata]